LENLDMQKEIIKRSRARSNGPGTPESPQNVQITEREPVPSPDVVIQLPQIAGTDEQMQAERVRQLDAFAFKGTKPASQEGDWLSTVGMFTGDVAMLEISEETRKIRNNQRTS
jgi:hypothetical protein